jgi:hypothetical protein
MDLPDLVVQLEVLPALVERPVEVVGEQVMLEEEGVMEVQVEVVPDKEDMLLLYHHLEVLYLIRVAVVLMEKM